MAAVSFVPKAPKPNWGEVLDDEEDTEEANPKRLDDEEPDATRVPLEVDDEGGMCGDDVADGLDAESPVRLYKWVCAWAGILTGPPA